MGQDPGKDIGEPVNLCSYSYTGQFFVVKLSRKHFFPDLLSQN